MSEAAFAFPGQWVGAVWIFGWAFFCLLVWYLLSRRRLKIMEFKHKERLAALEKGVPAPEWPELETKRRRSFTETMIKWRGSNPRWALGAGAFFVLLGIGLSIAFYLSDKPELKEIWSLGFIGVFLGLGLALQYVLTRTGKR